jgi:peptide/nickel transport system permease protein
MMFGGASEEARQAFIEQWGLNQPLYIQYLSYMEGLLALNFGTSMATRKPVLEMVGIRIFNTFILVAPAVTLAYATGWVYGILMGSNYGSKLEKYSIIPLVVLGSFPSFVLAIFMILIFSSLLGWFPTGGIITSDALRAAGDEWYSMYFTESFAKHYALPFVTVLLRYLYFPSLIMRTSVVEVMSEGYIRYERIVGLPKLERLAHIGRNASLPLITIYPISMTRAIGGLVLIELVFNWPGIGFTLVEAVFNRDTPVVQFVFFVIGAFIILANFFVDLTYSVIDPRVTIED